MEGLKEYITSTDGLTDSVLVSLQNQAEDVLKAYAANSFGDGETFKGMSYLGNYILTKKNRDSYGASEHDYPAYQVTVHDNYTRRQHRCQL